MDASGFHTVPVTYTTRLLYFTKLMGLFCSAGINGKVELVQGTNQLLVFKFKKDEKKR